MKILFITAPLYDYLADSLLIGFRNLFEDDCVDYPRKPLMYGEFPSVYGRGFTVWSKPIPDIPMAARKPQEVDLVIYSNYRRQKPIDWRVLVKNQTKAPRIIYLDGNDDSFIHTEVKPFFKRELFTEHPNVFPIGFCVPDHLVRPLNLSKKTQLHQTHVQDPEFASETGYKFTDEKDYYDDMARSFFGITIRKGGWDCMRHYELLAAGTLVMFRDYNIKPKLAAPQCPYFIHYSNKKEFLEITNRLLVAGKPTAEYIRILNLQRDWLLSNATSTARARQLLAQVKVYFACQPMEPMPSVTFSNLRRLWIKCFVLKEDLMLRIITFVKQNQKLEKFYYNVFRKIPGVGLFISRVLLREKHVTDTTMT